MQLHENLVVADRYQLVRMIGRGGMGSVWQAVHLSLDQPCALKFIEGEVANVADAHARFEREAKAAAQLRSPHVVQIIDHGVWQGRPYIAMELLEGEDLGKTLALAGGTLPPERINTIVQQVCRALTKAHQAGIVHRDLKPDNIFLVTDDDRQIVKILDFGVAKQTSQGIDGSNTKTGAMLGTPYFMSPEQAQGIKSVDARSDLWSLAVIVYLCLTGQRPFDSEALGDLLVKIIVNPVPVPSTVAQVPPGFDAWWARAAARNPDNRFPTAKEFATALAVALGGAEDPNAQTAALPTPRLRGTAMMNHPTPGQQGNAHPNANAPPNAYPSATAHHNPSPSNPGGAVQTAYLPTPQPANPPSHLSQSAQHPPQDPALGLGGTGNPATFSGVEPPVFLPKKGPPVAIFVGLGALALIGLAGAGVALTRRGTTSTHGPSAPESASVSAPVSAASAEPPPPASATVAAVESAAPSSTTEAPAPSGAVAQANPTFKGVVAPVPKASASGVSVTPKPTAATSASSKKSTMDDRKW